MSQYIPEPIQEIIDRVTAAVDPQGRVEHELVFSYDGNVLASFRSANPIQLPTVGSTIAVFYNEVIVREVDLRYTMFDGVQQITATVEIVPV